MPKYRQVVPAICQLLFDDKTFRNFLRWETFSQFLLSTKPSARFFGDKTFNKSLWRRIFHPVIWRQNFSLLPLATNLSSTSFGDKSFHSFFGNPFSINLLWHQLFQQLFAWMGPSIIVVRDCLYVNASWHSLWIALSDMLYVSTSPSPLSLLICPFSGSWRWLSVLALVWFWFGYLNLSVAVQKKLRMVLLKDCPFFGNRFRSQNRWVISYDWALCSFHSCLVGKPLGGIASDHHFPPPGER